MINSKSINTTPLNSFTDGLIPLVEDTLFIGKIFTDNFTDKIRLSEYWSSEIPCSVANLVGNKKKPNTDGTPMVLQMGERAEIFFSSENFIDIIIPSVFSTVITDGLAVGDCGMGNKYFRTLYKIPTDMSAGNCNGKHRRNIFVGDCGMGGNFCATLGKIPTAWFRL